MTEPTTRGGFPNAEIDRRVAEVAARNGRAPAPVTIRHVSDEPTAKPGPEVKPERKPPLTASERHRVRDLRAGGATFAAIAAEVGCSEPTARRAARAATPAEPRPAKPERTLGPPPVLAQALAIMDSELERLTELQDVRDRLARLIP